MVRNDVPAIVCEDPDGRTARITRDGEGEPIGAALFFTPSELGEIGVNTVAADLIELRIEDGEVRLVPISHGRE